MKRLGLIILAFCVASCGPEQEQAAFPHFSEEGGRVRDLAELLDPALEAELTRKLDAAQDDYGYQLVVVTVPSLHGYEIEEFSLEYARAWGIGNAERNDGLQILLAPNERKVRIEVGRGIEQHFTDVYCAEIVNDLMIPHFRDGAYALGVTQAVDAMIAHMQLAPTIPANDDEQTSETEDLAA